MHGELGCRKCTASNLVTNKRSKHLDLECNLIRDFAITRIIKLKCISTARDNAAIMTKPLQIVNYSYFTNVPPQDKDT